MEEFMHRKHYCKYCSRELENEEYIYNWYCEECFDENEDDRMIQNYELIQDYDYINY